MQGGGVYPECVVQAGIPGPVVHLSTQSWLHLLPVHLLLSTGYRCSVRRCTGETPWAQSGPGAWVRSLCLVPGPGSVRKEGGFSAGREAGDGTESGNNWIAEGQCGSY